MKCHSPHTHRSSFVRFSHVRGRRGGGGGSFLAVFGTATPPRLIDRFTSNLVCRYIIISGKCSFTLKSILTIFLALWPKVHFCLEDCQKEIALSFLSLTLLTCNLACKYIGVVWIFMYIFKSLPARFFDIGSKIHFYTFFIISLQLIDQFSKKIVGIHR